MPSHEVGLGQASPYSVKVVHVGVGCRVHEELTDVAGVAYGTVQSSGLTANPTVNRDKATINSEHFILPNSHASVTVKGQ